ncbi:MAG: hypothetical protein KKD63_16405 [Proteobacteria bacterium]|nr:hypothetical protein [Desulfobulbaceae bacterium]MBU4154453.1 hypothetical protein [Pseudomonadota bacterium]
MARPAIEKDKYLKAIEQLTENGARLEEITATKLQKIVGGQYSRCVSVIDEYMATIKAQAKEEETAPMPIWFKDFVGGITQIAEGTWFKIASEMRKSVDELTTSFAEKRIVLESQRKEDLQQIADLEAMVEKQDEALTKRQDEIDQLGQAKAKVEGELGATKAELKELTGRHIALEKEKSVLAADLKVGLVAIDQHQKIEFAQEQKINELEAVVIGLKGKEKELEHRSIVAETRTKELESNLAEGKILLAKTQAEKAQALKETKEVQAQAFESEKAAQLEKSNIEKTAQATISTLEKKVAVATEKSAGLTEQIQDLKRQHAEALKKKAEGQQSPNDQT